MAKRAAISSNARRALVISYVTKGLVHSQSDLVELLADEGVEVTQATASRDLELVGAVRGKDDQGRMRYLILDPATSSPGVSGRVSETLILNITASGNLVVVKTPPGGAQLLASLIDRATSNGDLSSAIGTIAGDDTVLVVSRSATGGKNLISDLKKFLSASDNLKKARRR
ncbi:MAG: arginine repressor [Candidatus Nanopelagicaceae bacterium]|nr:arginine repressor [Candidatus Nanopelagicaceae bacterium]